MRYEINHIWTVEMKWKWRKDRHSERNLCNCVKWPEKNSGLQWGLNQWPRDYWCDALPTELWSHWRWEQVNCGFICESQCVINVSYVINTHEYSFFLVPYLETLVVASLQPTHKLQVLGFQIPWITIFRVHAWRSWEATCNNNLVQSVKIHESPLSNFF